MFFMSNMSEDSCLHVNNQVNKHIVVVIHFELNLKNLQLKKKILWIPLFKKYHEHNTKTVISLVFHINNEKA